MRIRFSTLPLTSCAAVAFLAFAVDPASALKKAAYPEVKVALADAFKPDAAFETMQKAFAAAVAAKNAEALFALVGPTFVWTMEGGPVSDFDMGRGPVDNFKTVFGFRKPDAASDGGVPDGPFWEALSAYVADATYYKVPDAGNLVCGPLGADVADQGVFDKARDKIDTDDDPALWYFTVAPTVATATPDAKAAQVAKLGLVALPVLGVHPPQDDAKPTHVEVLLPSGKSGWVAADQLRPLVSNRLCYSKTPQGDWKITTFDQNEE